MIILGSWWASIAWSRYWGWDPKETAALVTWLDLCGLPPRPQPALVGRPPGGPAARRRVRDGARHVFRVALVQRPARLQRAVTSATPAARSSGQRTRFGFGRASSNHVRPLNRRGREGRIHGPGVELRDDLNEQRCEMIGQGVGEVEFLPAPLLRHGRRPRLSQQGARRSSAAGSASPCACRCRAPDSRPSPAGRSARRCEGRSGPSRPERRPAIRRPVTPPSGTRTNTPPFRSTACADATCCSTPTPPRHTGSMPPTRCSSHSRHFALNADGPLPRNQTRGSSGCACMIRNGSIQPRWMAATSR